jgi:hypothetical protein
MRRRLAEAGQVDGDDVAVRREQRHDRIPRLTAVADAVDQYQRLATACPGEDDFVHLRTVNAEATDW